jgi:hypothetical protein
MKLCPVRNRVLRRSLFGNGSAEEGNQCNGILGFLVAAARFDPILRLRNLPDWTGNYSWPEVRFEEVGPLKMCLVPLPQNGSKRSKRGLYRRT